MRLCTHVLHPRTLVLMCCVHSSAYVQDEAETESLREQLQTALDNWNRVNVQVRHGIQHSRDMCSAFRRGSCWLGASGL